MKNKTWITLILITVFVASHNEAFSPGRAVIFTFKQQTQQSTATHLTTLFAEKDDEAVLTDLDARVLQEMLRDSQKLGLEEEENMRSLLERGIRSKEATPNQQDSEEETEDSPFQSEILKKIGSTKLWKALERKAEDWVESAKIYVANRVERDAKLLASLGIFAFERAMQDVARALPASSSAGVKKKVFMLSNTTKAQEMSSKSIRQDMSTPFDEIRSVGREIKDIFNTVGPTASINSNGDEEEPTQPVKKTPFSKNLKSAASSSKYAVNDKERFQKVYERQKETTLKREKENVVQTTTRIANEVVDGAYQIKREVEVEPNKPGYKSKAIREQAAKTTNLLASGAKKFLGGAKNLALAALEASRQEDKLKTLKLPETASTPTPTTEIPRSTSTQTTASEDPPSTKRVPWTSTNFGATTTVAPPSLERLELEDILETEMDELMDRLTYCIQNPQETWLNPDLLLSTEFSAVPEDLLEFVVVTMVQAQASLQQEGSFNANPIESLQMVKDQIDQICFACQESGFTTIAEYLEASLINRGVNNGQIPVLQQLDIYQEKLIELEEFQRRQQEQEEEARLNVVDEEYGDNSVQEAKPWFVDDNDGSEEVIAMDSLQKDRATIVPPSASREVAAEEVEFFEASSIANPVTVTEVQEVEILDAIPTGPRTSDSPTIGTNIMETEYQTPVFDEDDGDSFMAEIVTDDDFEVAMGQGAKSVDENIPIDDDEEDEPNPVAMWALRSLDVVLLATEKTAKVVPGLVNLGGTVSERVSNAKSDGLGSEGWEIIVSAKRGERKY